MALIQKAFSDIITFSRSSNATRVGPTGVLEYAPHNLLTYSQQFDNAAWGKTNSSVTANAVAAPDGTVTADKITETATSAPHQFNPSPVVALNTVYTLSIYAKAAERNWVILNIFTGTDSCWTWFNVSTGVVGTVGAGASAAIQSVGNGWFRCSISILTASSGTPNVAYWIADADGSINYTGVAGYGIYVWGAQLAVGPYALDYVPTTSAAVYGPRFDYDGSGVTIVEPVSTNLLTYSQEFDNAAWGKSVTAVTANNATAPDGTLTADTATIQNTGYLVQTYTAPSLLPYVLSVWMRAASSTTVKVGFTSPSDVTSCNVTTTWQRFTHTNGRSGLFYPQIYNDSGSAVTVELWGAQLEVGSTATAYMVSGASNGFRAVPVVSGSATPKGLLVEEQRQNLVAYSEDFSNAAWTKNNCTVTANSVASPDGTVNADTVTSTSTTTAVELYGSATISSGASYTLSCFYKAGTYSKAALRCYNGGTSNTPLALFNLTTKSVIATYGNVTATSVQDYGNGWLRCIMTFTSTGTNANPQVNGLADTYTLDGTYNYVATLGSNGSIYAWGAQLEAGSFATSLIPTLASAVTRSADVASVNTLSPWFNNSAGSFLIEFFMPSPEGQLRRLMDIENTSTGTYQNIIAFNGYSVSASNMYFEGISSGSSQFSIDCGPFLANTSYKVAMTYQVNDFAVSVNGASVLTDTTGTVASGLDKLWLGSHRDGNFYTGYIKRFAFYPRRLTNAELQALSA